MIISNLSLRAKSILLMMLTGFTALAFAVTAFIGYEILMFRESAESEISAIARIVGLNSMASLSFRDSAAAQETLESLSTEANVISAALYDKDGNLFSHISKNIEPARSLRAPDNEENEPSMQWDGQILHVLYPIIFEQERLGTVALSSSQTDLTFRLRTYLLISLGIMLVSSLVAYGLAVFSQRFTTGPVVALQRTMTTVAETRDYSIRAEDMGDDELGVLAKRFNGMLDQIQRQDIELRQHREMLEENVRMRTHELQETISELRVAKDRAEEASRAKMQFLANISQEIRTPMNGVLGIAEILAKSSLTDRQRQLLLTLQQSGADLMTIINDILDFSKLEAGKFDLNVITFNLHTLLDNCIGVFSANARDKSLEIASIIHPGVPRHIQSDPDRIRQILINLLGNALKFTTSGSVVLTARLGKTEATQGQLVLEVQDSGIGIAPSAQASIFSPFTQADDTMTRTHGGTGLGLTIVSQLVTLLEGGIDLVSAPGQGSTFTVTIPFIFPEDAEHRDTPTAYTDLQAATIGMSALYRKALDNILGRVGIRPAHHAAAEDMLNGPAASKRTLIFIDDGQLAGRDDLALATLRHHGGPESRVVLITGSTIEPDHDVDFVLTKPPRQSEMHNMLLEVAGVVNQAQKTPDEATVFDARVLLVEDNDVNQKVATSALQIFGLDVDIAANGLIALEMATSASYDLIFMDCQMPIMDGYTTTTKLREWELAHRPGIRVPIVALTAHALSKDRLLCFQRGMDDYVTKPFTLDTLHRCLCQWLPPQTHKSAPIARPEHAPRTEKTPIPPLSETEVQAVRSAPPLPESTGGATSTALDPAVIESLLALQRRGSADLLIRLFEAYETSATDLLAGIDRGLNDGDLDLVRQHAHTLKSSSHNVGAVSLGRMALDLETTAREGNLPRARELSAQILAEYASVLEAIATQRDAR